MVIHYLEKLDKSDIVNRVCSIIIAELSSGNVNKKYVADQLCMSPRNLQLKLSDRDTSFQIIMDETRRKMGMGYIVHSDLSITEIAYLLGFSDAANFTRAFRRWVGKPPREYRAEHHT